jgi:hypothetical protein
MTISSLAPIRSFLSHRERILLSVFATFVAVLVFLPYMVGLLATKQGSEFVGTPLLAIADYRSYLVWIGQAMHGEVLFFNYSAPPSLSSDGVLFHPIFFTLGMIGKWLSLSPMLLFHLASAGFAWLLVWTAYRFFAELTAVVRWRAIATTLFVGATGIGAILFAPPSVFNGPEFSMLVRMQQYPLGSIDTILTFTIFILVLTELRHGRVRDAVLLGLLVGMLVLIHPYMLLIVLGTLGSFALFTLWKEHDRSLVIALLRATVVLLPFVWWQVNALALDPSFALWFFSGMLTERFTVVELLLGYGFLLPLSLWGGYLLVRSGSDLPHRAPLALLCLWGVVMTIGMEQPLFLSVTRRFGEMLFIPLVFFAAYPLVRLSRLPALKWWGVPIAASLLVGNVLFFHQLFLLASAPAGGPLQQKFAPQNTLSSDTLTMLNRLDTLSGRDDVVLSGGALGSIIPFFADTRVVFGHPSLMPSEPEKNLLIPQLLRRAGESGHAWERYLHGITFIVVDQELRDLGYVPANDPFVEPVFRNDTYTIYRVKKGNDPSLLRY